jgi:hypothetical protein
MRHVSNIFFKKVLKKYIEKREKLWYINNVSAELWYRLVNLQEVKMIIEFQDKLNQIDKIQEKIDWLKREIENGYIDCKLAVLCDDPGMADDVRNHQELMRMNITQLTANKNKIKEGLRKDYLLWGPQNKPDTSLNKTMVP